MSDYTCDWCGYTATESTFLDGVCPACCRDNITGEEIPNSIPTVFHMFDPEDVKDRVQCITQARDNDKKVIAKYYRSYELEIIAKDELGTPYTAVLRGHGGMRVQIVMDSGQKLNITIPLCLDDKKIRVSLEKRRK